MKSFHTIGMMSGTSMDGIDIVEVTFTQRDNQWEYHLLSSSLFSYSKGLLKRLREAQNLSSEALLKLSHDLGCFYAECVNTFIQENNIEKSKLDFIASHGQTIFHQPQKGYTLQIGNGPELAVHSNCVTITDFRSKDVALGGNGAPLIPVADYLLFNRSADSFLNLGGFSNLSYKKNKRIFSYDICPTNIVVDYLIKEINQDYDKDGAYGKAGQINTPLLNQLNNCSYYQKKGPKSLGWEWVEEEILPLFQLSLPLQDKIRTYYEHIAMQIGKNIHQSSAASTLITGGGAKNSFLIERIKHYSHNTIIIPDINLIDYKEAIGFAFLGVLRFLNQNNVWASVTGSTRDSSSGRIIIP